MKKKIVLLVLLLVFIPATILGASPYTKTEKVTYNSCSVTLDGVTLTDTVTIKGKTYVSAKDISLKTNKSFDVDSLGNVMIARKMRQNNFGYCNWGDSSSKVIRTVNIFPNQKQFNGTNGKVTYKNSFWYGFDCELSFLFENNELCNGYIQYYVDEKTMFGMFNSLIDSLYKEFGIIDFVSFYTPDDCPSNVSAIDSIKKYGAYQHAQFTDGTDKAYLCLQNDEYTGNLIIYILVSPVESYTSNSTISSTESVLPDFKKVLKEKYKNNGLFLNTIENTTLPYMTTTSQKHRDKWIEMYELYMSTSDTSNLNTQSILAYQIAVNAAITFANDSVNRMP